MGAPSPANCCAGARVELRHGTGVKAQSDAALVGNYDDAAVGAVQLCNAVPCRGEDGSDSIRRCILLQEVCD